MTSMYTVCPKCALTLAVTAGDLRVAQGHVRCGRCSHIFKALTRLTSEEHQSGEAGGPGAATLLAPRAGGGELGEEPLPDGTLEFNADVTKVFVEASPGPRWTANGTYRGYAPMRSEPGPDSAHDLGSDTAQFEVELTSEAVYSATLETPIVNPADKAGRGRGRPRTRTPPPSLPPPAPPAPPSYWGRGSMPERRVSPAQLPAPSPLPLRPALAATPALEEPVPVSSGIWKPRRTRMPPDPDLALPSPLMGSGTDEMPRLDLDDATLDAVPRPLVLPDVEDRSLPVPRPATRSAPALSLPPMLGTSLFSGTGAPQNLPWLAGLVALSVLLVLQIFHHYRNDLATTVAFGGAVTKLYGAFGVHLVPRWDLAAYDVRQLGASAAKGGAITVRASVKNAARHPQPLPLLRVTLQDRFGNRIAARDVLPASYVPASLHTAALLSAGQRIDAEMAFVDPGANAVGFEIDACLPAPGGGMACASDAGGH